MWQLTMTVFFMLSLVSLTVSSNRSTSVIVNSQIDGQIDSLISKVKTFQAIKETGFLNRINSDWAVIGSKLNADIVIKILQELKASLRNENSLCLEDIMAVIHSAMLGELWAIKVIDNSARLESGLLEGNNRWAGAYANCLSWNKTLHKIDGPQHDLKTKYCWVKAALKSRKIFKKSNYDVSFALCIPESCSASFIESITSKIIEMIPFTKKHTELVGSVCLDEFIYWGDSNRALGLTILLFIFGFLIIATLYANLKDEQRNLKTKGCFSQNICNGEVGISLVHNDKESKSIQFVWDKTNENACSSESSEDNFVLSDEKELTNSKKQKDNKLYRLFTKTLRKFSIFQNSSVIFDLNQEQDNVIEVLHGIRFFSLSWFLFANSFYLMIPLIGNSFVLADFENTFLCKIIFGSTFGMDSFLFISGLIVIYTKAKQAANYGIINWVRYFFRRYLRLAVPMLIAIVLFDILLHTLYTDSPFYRLEHNNEADNCETKWWQNLFLIQNYENPLKSCHPYSWFIANLFQISLITPLAVTLIFRNTYLSSLCGVIVIAASSLITFIISISGDLSSQVGFKYFFEEGIEGISQRFMSVQEKILMKPYCRITPFIVGLACGCYLNKMNGKIRIKAGTVTLCWTLSAITALMVVFSNVNGEPGAMLSALYFALSPIAWSVVLAWTVIACSNGYGRYISPVFTWKHWYPYSRITYSTFLIHHFIGNGLFNVLERQIYLSEIRLLTVCGSVVGMSYFGGLFFYLAIEAPILRFLRKPINDHSS